MQEKKRRILREIAGDQSEMEAMLQVERNKIKTRVENQQTIKIKRYAQNFSSRNKVVELDRSDREVIVRYAELFKSDKFAAINDK